MAIPYVDLDARHELVCSADPSVSLKPVKPAPTEADPNPNPVVAPRYPVRWMRRDDDRVELVHPDATVLTVRLLNDTEQVEVTGGLQGFASGAVGQARHKALRLGLLSCRDGERHALTPQEVERFRSRLPLRFWEMAGDWILDASCGFSDPFARHV